MYVYMHSVGNDGVHFLLYTVDKAPNGHGKAKEIYDRTRNFQNPLEKP